MRGVAMLAAITAVVFPASFARAETPVTYTVSPRFEGQALTALQVEIEVTTDSSGKVRLSLPKTWMGHGHLWRNLRDLAVDGGASIAEDGDDIRLIRSAPGRRLVVRYTLSSVIDHEPRESDGYPALPWVRPDWFFVDTDSALPTVHGHDAAPARLRWKGWPSGFAVDSSFVERPDLTETAMGGGLLIGGRDLRIVRADEVRLAIHGRFDNVDNPVLAQDLRTILRAERGFFGETDHAPYLIAAATLTREDGEAFSGTGKQDAFGLTVTPGLSLDQLRPYLAHEFFHAWNPTRLGGPESASSRYWFSEGFTDFYMRRILVREGLITPQAFVDLWNGMLRAYATSPARNLTGEEAGRAFWTDRFAEKLPYQRGALLAALWDERLRAKGSSLDAVIRAQARTAANKTEKTSAIDLFIAQAAKAGLDVRPDIAAFAERGESIVLPSTAFAPCADVVEVIEPVFDLGFTPTVGNDGVRKVTALVSDSPAARAGLRGDEVILDKLSGNNGDPGLAYVLKVQGSDGAVRTVSFLPQGKAQATYPQLRMRPEVAAKPTLCAFGR